MLRLPLLPLDEPAPLEELLPELLDELPLLPDELLPDEPLPDELLLLGAPLLLAVPDELPPLPPEEPAPLEDPGPPPDEDDPSTALGMSWESQPMARSIAASPVSLPSVPARSLPLRGVLLGSEAVTDMAFPGLFGRGDPRTRREDRARASPQRVNPAGSTDRDPVRSGVQPPERPSPVRNRQEGAPRRRAGALRPRPHREETSGAFVGWPRAGERSRDPSHLPSACVSPPQSPADREPATFAFALPLRPTHNEGATGPRVQPTRSSLTHRHRRADWMRHPGGHPR